MTTLPSITKRAVPKRGIPKRIPGGCASHRGAFVLSVASVPPSEHLDGSGAEMSLASLFPSFRLLVVCQCVPDNRLETPPPAVISFLRKARRVLAL